jgi:hypothetical protein
MEKNIDAAIRWLCESDILNKDKQQTSFGGVNNGYLWKEKKYQYVYSEITGYAINSFISISKWLADNAFFQYAKNSADYLIQLQEKEKSAFEYGGILHSLSLPDLNRNKKYYSFDNAVILHGLVNLYMLAKDERYYLACINIGDFLSKMQKDDGSFYSFYDSENESINHRSDEFFFDFGCLHVKNCIGLFLLDQISGQKRYYQAALRVCDWGQRLQEKDGLFWANINKKYVFTHAHCYATEGYLYAYHFTGKQNYLNVAQKAGEALLDLQNSDGSLYRIYKNKLFMKYQYSRKIKKSFKRWFQEKKYPWKTLDATSQAVRIWSLLYSINKEVKFLEAAIKAVDFVMKNQALEVSDPNLKGGIFYQICNNFDGNEVKLSGGMYTWCTQFGLSAFMLLKSAQKNKKFEELIIKLF